jgi:transposase
LPSRLRSAPRGRAGELEPETRRAVVLGLVAALKPLVEQTRLPTSEIRGLLADHPDGQIFQSLFRDPKSVVTAAEPLAEIGDRRDRHRSSSSFEAVAGQRAVAVESDKRKIGSFRWACNKTLRSAVAVLADSSPKSTTPGRRRSTPTRSPAATTTGLPFVPFALAQVAEIVRPRRCSRATRSSRPRPPQP